MQKPNVGDIIKYTAKSGRYGIWKVLTANEYAFRGTCIKNSDKYALLSDRASVLVSWIDPGWTYVESAFATWVRKTRDRHAKQET